MNRIKKLTLLITLYKPTDTEKKYWFSFYLKNRKKIKIFFLVDGTKIEFNKKISEDDIFIGKVNKGKFRMVYDFIKDGNVTTPYFKIVDPDDYIYLNNIKDKYFGTGNDILFHPIFRGKEINKNHNIKIKYKLLTTRKKYWTSNFGNSYTIYPTKFIEDDKIFNKDWEVPIHDDQVLGFLCLGNGAETSRFKKTFYYYNEFNGVTNSNNINTMLEKASITFDILSRINKKTNIERYSDWPFNYKWYKDKIEAFIKSNKEVNKEKLYKKLDYLKAINIYEHLDKKIKENNSE